MHTKIFNQNMKKIHACIIMFSLFLRIIRYFAHQKMVLHTYSSRYTEAPSHTNVSNVANDPYKNDTLRADINILFYLVRKLHRGHTISELFPVKKASQRNTYRKSHLRFVL